MACRLAGDKPLSEPMLEYCKLDPWQQNFNEILIEIYLFSFKKMHLKIAVSRSGSNFVPGLNVLTACIRKHMIMDNAN